MSTNKGSGHFCNKCNRTVNPVEDGWICFICGANGSDYTPAFDLHTALVRGQPLSQPHVRTDLMNNESHNR